MQLLPDLARAVDGEVVVVDTGDLGLQGLVTLASGAGGARFGRVVGSESELEGFADRPDSPSIPSGIDVANYFLD